jgi:hypothetical protein
MTEFRKSTYSDPQQECVEIGHTVALFGVRDSKLPRSPILTITPEHGRSFLNTVRTGCFDR